ncbi:UNVERIFIED_CONTAM: hypothetical protein K2H54_042540 [Gekko kuhli]
MEKWIVGIAEDQTVECVVTYESDVRTPKSTRHIQSVQWCKTKLQDEVKSIQLKIQTPLSNSEAHPRSRSNSSIDCQWMSSLRMHVKTSPSLQHSRPHSPIDLLNLPYLQNQDSYAAAVRRTHVPLSYQVTSLSQSRSSSPTPYLSSLHLNSKGSSTSSAASDSPSERDRSKSRNRNNYHSSASRKMSTGGRRFIRSPTGPQATARNSDKFYRTLDSTFSPSHHPSRSHDHKKYAHSQQPPKPIPGMPLQTESQPKEVAEEESKVSEGGWTKVDYSKKSHRHVPAGKQNKEKSKGTGRGQRKSQ